MPMLLFSPRPDLPAVHLLADHLEGIERLGLEILSLRCSAPSEAARQSAAGIRTELARLSAFVDRLAGLEIAIAAKLKSARTAADRVARADRRLATFAMLFKSGTQGLVDALPALIDLTEDAFHHRAEPLPFLQGRGVLALDSFSVAALGEVRVPPGYLVCGKAQLDALLELTDTCLTALDAHYGLYEPQPGDVPTAIAAALDDARDRVRPDPVQSAAAADPMDLGPPGELPPDEEPVDLIGALVPEEVAAATSEPDVPHHEIRDAIDLIAALAENVATDQPTTASPVPSETVADEVIDLVGAAPEEVSRSPEPLEATALAMLPAEPLPTLIALPELPPEPGDGDIPTVTTLVEAAPLDAEASAPPVADAPESVAAVTGPNPESPPADEPVEPPSSAHSLRAALALALPAEDGPAPRSRRRGKAKKPRGKRKRQDDAEPIVELSPASPADVAAPLVGE
jgi:hypothetical protein